MEETRLGDLALRLGLGFLFVLAFFVPAALQYGDIAEVFRPDRACSGLTQMLIAFIVSHYPISVYVMSAAILITLFLAPVRMITLIPIIIFALGINILPQFFLVCS